MKYVIAFMTLLVCSIPVQAKLIQDPFELILNSLHQCYDNENKIGAELAKCLLAKTRKSSNPEGYKVNIVDDNPSKTIPSNITITIYNKWGQVFVCKGIAQEKIIIKKCTGKKIPKLNPGEELSITPP